MIVHQRLAERVFGAFILGVIVLIVGYQHVWQELSHPVAPDKFRIDAQKTLSVTRETRLVLDLYARGRVTRTYFQTLCDNVAHSTLEDLRAHRTQRPDAALAAAFDAYQRQEARLADVASALASPAFQAAAIPAWRDSLDAIESSTAPLTTGS
jgi:hypothetical protein